MYLICKLLYIAIFAVLSAAQPYLPIYYHDTLNFSSDQIGLVLAIAPFIQSISCPLWTYIVDKKPALHGFIMALTAFLGGAAIMAIMFIGQSSGTLFGIELSNTLLVVVVSSLALGFAFFTLPNMALVDSAVMKILGPNKILYGKQPLTLSKKGRTKVSFFVRRTTFMGLCFGCIDYSCCRTTDILYR